MPLKYCKAFDTLVGSFVTIHESNGSSFDGVLKSVTQDSITLVFVTPAISNEVDNLTEMISVAPTQTFQFSAVDCVNVVPHTAVCDMPLTDAEISARNPVAEPTRTAVTNSRWLEDASDEDDFEPGSKIGNWDQFGANQRAHQIDTQFDPTRYSSYNVALKDMTPEQRKRYEDTCRAALKQGVTAEPEDKEGDDATRFSDVNNPNMPPPVPVARHPRGQQAPFRSPFTSPDLPPPLRGGKGSRSMASTPAAAKGEPAAAAATSPQAAPAVTPALSPDNADPALRHMFAAELTATAVPPTTAQSPQPAAAIIAPASPPAAAPTAAPQPAATAAVAAQPPADAPQAAADQPSTTTAATNTAAAPATAAADRAPKFTYSGSSRLTEALRSSESQAQQQPMSTHAGYHLGLDHPGPSFSRGVTPGFGHDPRRHRAPPTHRMGYPMDRQVHHSPQTYYPFPQTHNYAAGVSVPPTQQSFFGNALAQPTYPTTYPMPHTQPMPPIPPHNSGYRPPGPAPGHSSHQVGYDAGSAAMANPQMARNFSHQHHHQHHHQHQSVPHHMHSLPHHSHVRYPGDHGHAPHHAAPPLHSHRDAAAAASAAPAVLATPAAPPASAPVAPHAAAFPPAHAPPAPAVTAPPQPTPASAVPAAPAAAVAPAAAPAPGALRTAPVPTEEPVTSGVGGGASDAAPAPAAVTPAPVRAAAGASGAGVAAGGPRGGGGAGGNASGAPRGGGARADGRGREDPRTQPQPSQQQQSQQSQSQQTQQRGGNGSAGAAGATAASAGASAGAGTSAGAGGPAGSRPRREPHATDAAPQPALRAPSDPTAPPQGAAGGRGRTGDRGPRQGRGGAMGGTDRPPRNDAGGDTATPSKPTTPQGLRLPADSARGDARRGRGMGRKD